MDGGAESVKAIAGSPGASGATGTAPSLHAASATVSTGSNERDIRAVAINRRAGPAYPRVPACPQRRWDPQASQGRGIPGLAPGVSKTRASEIGRAHV